MATESVNTTLGAILVGCIVAATLSGLVAVQVSLYFRIYYASDPLRMKLMVFLIWFLDAAHTILTCYSTWEYLILNFGNVDIADYIPISLGLTIAITAFLTWIVHLFFCFRVLRFSKGNWYLCAPLIALTFARLIAASITTSELLIYRGFHEFRAHFGWCFTLGLALSSAIDVIIACALCYYLQTNRTGFSSMDHIIDQIIMFSINHGALTSAVTVLSLLFWLAMPTNLIYFAFHLAISKLYANSLLGTLNTRRALRGRVDRSSEGLPGDHALPVLFPQSFSRHGERSGFGRSRCNDQTPSKLEIGVEKTVQYDVDGVTVDLSGHEPRMMVGSTSRPSAAK